MSSWRLARPRQLLAHAEVPDIIDMATAYTAQAVLGLAAGNLDETGYSAFLRGNVGPVREASV